MNQPFFIDEAKNQGVIIAEKEYFTRDAVLLVADQYSKTYFVSVYPENEHSVRISIIPKEGQITEVNLRSMMNELIDYQIRVDLEKKFGEIRNKIVDYAFSTTEQI